MRRTILVVVLVMSGCASTPAGRRNSATALRAVAAGLAAGGQALQVQRVSQAPPGYNCWPNGLGGFNCRPY